MGRKCRDMAAGVLIALAAAAPSFAASTETATVPAKFTDGRRTIFIDSGEVSVGVDKRWGGAIREIWFAGQNLVNDHDGGRLVGVSFYDSDRLPAPGNPDDTGWNPTPSDAHDAANLPVAYSFRDNTVYVKTRLIQWYPDNKGGGASHPVPTDVIAETWIGFVGDRRTIHLRYRLTNVGRDDHGSANQEFPFAYVRTPFNRFVGYSGDAPWTMGAPTMRRVPLAHDGSAEVVASEFWGGWVDGNDVGLVLWAPQSYPELTYSWFANPNGEKENPTLYLLPRSLFGIEPGQSKEVNAYIFVGKWQDARKRIYGLHKELTLPDIMPGFGTVDARPANARVSGTIPVDGWAVDDRGVRRIEVRVDNRLVGTATYGGARADVAHDYPGLPGAPNFGFDYGLDTTVFKNGLHRLQVRVVDVAGNSSRLINGDSVIDVRN